MKPEVGQWYSRCCEEDLYQIETEEDVREIEEELEEFEGLCVTVRVWPTREEALADLAKVRTLPGGKADDR